MTHRKDFKRVVRARSRRTGESYSSALRNVRNARPARSAATASEGNHKKEPLMSITRTIPDVRSTDIDKTVRFYTELLGFDARTEDERVVSFVSSSHDGVEVTLNRDGFALPPGFIVEVESDTAVTELYDRAPGSDVRVVEPLHADGSQFSALDPSGLRVTITAADANRPPAATGDWSRVIARAIPETVVEPTSAKRFYANYLGLRTLHEWSDVVMFESPTCAGAQILAGICFRSPSAFDVDVGTTARVDAIHAAALGNAVVMGSPQDFPDKGVRCCLLIDPNGVAINVVAPLDPMHRST